MLDILLAIGQILSVMALVYGFFLCAAHRKSADRRPARVAAHVSRNQDRIPVRPHRAAARAAYSR
jgi:hypothetical protein